MVDNTTTIKMYPLWEYIGIDYLDVDIEKILYRQLLVGQWNFVDSIIDK